MGTGASEEEEGRERDESKVGAAGQRVVDDGVSNAVGRVCGQTLERSQGRG